tara:strand:- start:252 stop:569 length:318 start_codon:yes stop_codon:yes gene_type:complete
MENFWTSNSIVLLIGLTLFPRLSLLFCNIHGTILFWIGWLIFPRITIAIFATLFYSSTNPILVILSWLIALGGESAEKSYGYKVKRKRESTKTHEIEYEVIDENK